MNNSHKHGKHAERREKRSGLSTFKKFTILSVFCFAAVISMMSAASDSRIAYITDGSETYMVTTADDDTKDIIEEAGLELNDFDEAVVTEESSERIDISIIRAFPITVTSNEGKTKLEVTGGTVADALKLANTDFSVNDFVTPVPTAELKKNMNISVKKGVKIYLTCGGSSSIVYVPEGKIGESLNYAGYQLTEDDALNVDINAPVKSGMKINVDKVLNRTTTKKQKIESHVIEQTCSTLPEGEKKVKQEGKEGSIEITYKEKYVNDVLTEKKEVSRKIIYKAEDTIILVGTKEAQPKTTAVESESAKPELEISGSFEEKNTAEQKNETTEVKPEEKNVFADFGKQEQPEKKEISDSHVVSAVESEPKQEKNAALADDSKNDDYQDNSFDFSYSKMIVGTCTAYTELSGITSTGTIPRVGTVAVNPNVIPYGTRLYICSADGSFVYGYAVAEDTGTAAMAGDILVDLYMNTEEDCLAFGRQELNIYILD